MNKIWKFCEDCHVKLTDENRWGGDKYAGFCQTCWDKRMEDDSEIECENCGWPMEQDQSNLWRLYCPICKQEAWLRYEGIGTINEKMC